MSEFRPCWAEIDLAALRANVTTLRELAQPALLLAVVKADAYGHGAVPVSRAALDAGAAWLGVALVAEGAELRDAGIDAPILLLSEPPSDAADEVVARSLTPVVYTATGVDALAKAVAQRGSEPLAVHLKVDTGMHRVGCAPESAVALAQQIASRTELRLEGVLTHFAVADEPDNSYSQEQVARFESVLGELDLAGLRPPIVHAANSAGLFTLDAARYHLVRCGIALYGIPPAPELASRVPLEPVMSLVARVSFVKDVDAGTAVSYGLRYSTPSATRLATVPAGYADGVPRNLGINGGEVLVHGHRRPIAGAVTMDQLVVDVGALAVEPGDDVVFLGRQGDEVITAGEWAEHLGTIAYEVVCGIGPRMPRRYGE